MLYAILAAVALGLVTVAYLLLAPGPRRSRSYGRARRLVRDGNWTDALQAVTSLRPERQPSAWQARLNHVAGEAHQLAIDATLKEKAFEDALGHARRAAELLDLDVKEQEGQVVEAALAEIRRLYAAGPSETPALQAMLDRVAKLAGAEPPEATFWEALSLIRQGQLEHGLDVLAGLHQGGGKNVLDVPLYLGMLQHRLGRPQEALRALADANRIDPNCPFVPWQMGVSIMASNGDSGLALRALQRALGPRGLPQWQSQPDRLWVEALPEGKSWARRLAVRHRYVCPILGGDLSVVVRQGQLALAQAMYRQERFQEAADLYGQLMQEAPPTLLLMRGYGLALARLGQHDQAYKHLRLALEQEEPKDPFTAGYLALCGAMGKPTKADDRPRNVGWSLKLLAKYPLVGNAEWAGLVSAVHAEARKYQVPTTQEDLELLCDALAAVQAHDVRSAQAYGQLAGLHPDAVKPVHAWLYARACAVHNVTSRQDLDLFSRTFATSAEARAYFDKQGWDFREVEYAFLARCAVEAPGRFPEALGPDYAPRGEAFLLQRSAEQERAGKKDPARESVEVLPALSPTNVARTTGWPACTTARGTSTASASSLISARLSPGDHWPLVRRAILEQQRATPPSAPRRSSRHGPDPRAAPGVDRLPRRGWQAARRSGRLAAGRGPRPCSKRRCGSSPTRDARWCLAAVHCVGGDRAALAAMAPRLDDPAVDDPRFHFLAAVPTSPPASTGGSANWPSGRPGGGLEVESRFVVAWARLRAGDPDGAAALLRKVAESSSSLSAPYARAVLGRLGQARGDADEAARWWSALEPAGGRSGASTSCCGRPSCWPASRRWRRAARAGRRPLQGGRQARPARQAAGAADRAGAGEGRPAAVV
ncbi:MAG: hypothetical protein U0797_24205 [Gemmataceae bacterium]